MGSAQAGNLKNLSDDPGTKRSFVTSEHSRAQPVRRMRTMHKKDRAPFFMGSAQTRKGTWSL